jgi:DNA polymerase
MTSIHDELYTVARDLRERIVHEADWGLAGHERDLKAQRSAPSEAFVNALQVPRPPSAPATTATTAQQTTAIPQPPSPAAEVATALPPIPEAAIPMAVPVETLPTRAPSTRPAPDLDLFGAISPGEAGLAQIQEILGDCQRCGLHSGRQNLVFGRGNPTADLLFIGEGPGAAEDRQGLPFVGPAGQLLERMIQGMGILSEQVYIANVVKCRPPNNRDPEIEERLTCRPFLVGQLQAIQPKIIVTLGRIATQTVLETDGRISRLRGRWQPHPHHEAQVMPTYHPAAVLRNPQLRRPVWEDLKLVMDALGLQTTR